MDDYWIWCGSVISGDDGRCHMYASRWPKRYIFFEGYISHSQIVHAVAASPESPFDFADIVLPARGERFWDGQMTHNPTIMRWNDGYYLYYIGATYPGEQPPLAEHSRWISTYRRRAYDGIRIGVAHAATPDGPWRRLDEPILTPRPGKWDGIVVTNPAVCRTPGGRIRMYYRSNTPQGLRIGVAESDHPLGPFERLSDEPVLSFDRGFVEDPFVWWDGSRYQMLAKDLTAEITGEYPAGVHLSSADGLTWQTSTPPKAYSRRVRWSDGSETTQGSFERPQLLLQEGEPTHLFAATADGPGGFRYANRTWNMVVPFGQ